MKAEALFDRKLHYKKQGEWVPYTQEELTQQIIELRKAMNDGLNNLSILLEKLK